MSKSLQMLVLKALSILIVSMAVMLVSCNKKNTDSMTHVADKNKEALAFASNYLGDKSEVIPSADGSYFLCIKDRSPKISYAVTDLESNVILKTQTVRGRVEWHDSYSIIVKEKPGVIEDKRKKPSDYHRIIKLKEKL